MRRGSVEDFQPVLTLSDFWLEVLGKERLAGKGEEENSRSQCFSSWWSQENGSISSVRGLVIVQK